MSDLPDLITQARALAEALQAAADVEEARLQEAQEPAALFPYKYLDADDLARTSETRRLSLTLSYPLYRALESWEHYYRSEGRLDRSRVNHTTVLRVLIHLMLADPALQARVQEVLESGDTLPGTPDETPKAPSERRFT